MKQTAKLRLPQFAGNIGESSGYVMFFGHIAHHEKNLANYQNPLDILA
jgi:hypothetical protein